LGYARRKVTNANVEQLVGRTLGGRYRLERTLGVGGMGAVFEATQVDLGRTVAVKVLLDVDPRGIARLKQEALTAGSLSCPHVVSIFDFVAPEGEAPFIVMEILPGHSLATLLRHEPILAVPRAARIASQMLIALEAAHRAGVVHRDVKPSNTWLVFGPGVEEHVKVLDFGIAKMLDGNSALQTTTGSVVGTPAYLAPEQLRGVPLDGRVDIHAMGVVLFEMLTGTRPWQAGGASVYAEILERHPPPVHLLVPGIPPALSQIVLRALAKDPAARFARADDMRAALEPFIDATTAPAPPTVMGSLAGTPPTAYGSSPASPSSTRLPATAAYVSPTLDQSGIALAGPPMSAPHFTGGHVASVPHPSAPAGSKFVLPFVLGIGFVLVAGGGLAAAFVVGRDSRGTPGSIDAGSASVITPAPVPANDGGPRGPGPASAATNSGRGARLAAPIAAGPSASAASATSPKCACLNDLGGTICVVPKVPSCTCENRDQGGTLCPKPYVDHHCTVSNGDSGPYGGPGRANGQACSGFFDTPNGVTRTGTGTTDCQFCYGHDKFPGVPGASCKGMIGNGTTREGRLVCDR
jgi:serine/threonine-protein kinase